MIGKVSNFIGPSSVFSGNISNLVLWLDAGLTSSYPATGSTWHDISGNKNDATFVGNPVYDSNFIGNIQFNGISDYITFETTSKIPIGNSQYTISVWFKSNTYTTSGGFVGWGNYSNENQVNAFRLNNNSLTNYWWANDLTTDDLSLEASIWYNAVATYNGINRQIWINGTMSSYDTPGYNDIPFNTNLTVGVSDIGLNEYLDGSIGSIKIYNKSLNTNQIISEFKESKTRFGYFYSPRYIKWEITQSKGIDGFGSIQSSDLVFMCNGEIVNWNIGATISNPDGNSNIGEYPENLLDMNSSTKWCDTNFQLNGTSSIYIDNSTSLIFDSYYYVTGDDYPERDPITWTLSISDDNSIWSIIDTQSSISITDNRQTSTQIFEVI